MEPELGSVEDLRRDLKRNRSRVLVIDVRGAAGGELALAELVHSIYALKPYRVVQDMTVRLSAPPKHYGLCEPLPEFLRHSGGQLPARRESAGRCRLRPDDPRLELLEPQPNAFDGKVYVVCDAFTRQAAAALVMMARRAGRASIVREEVGTNHSLPAAAEAASFGCARPTPAWSSTSPSSAMCTRARPKSLLDRGELPDHAFGVDARALATGRDLLRDALIEMVRRAAVRTLSAIAVLALFAGCGPAAPPARPAAAAPWTERANDAATHFRSWQGPDGEAVLVLGAAMDTLARLLTDRCGAAAARAVRRSLDGGAAQRPGPRPAQHHAHRLRVRPARPATRIRLRLARAGQRDSTLRAALAGPIPLAGLAEGRAPAWSSSPPSPALVLDRPSRGMARLPQHHVAVPVCEYLEPHPLGRAEWLRFFGVLTGTSTVADSLYTGIAARYRARVRRADPDAPLVFVGSAWRGVWSVPAGNSLMARLVADAGARYRYADRVAQGNLDLPMEVVMADAHACTHWACWPMCPSCAVRPTFPAWISACWTPRPSAGAPCSWPTARRPTSSVAPCWNPMCCSPTCRPCWTQQRVPRTGPPTSGACLGGAGPRGGTDRPSATPGRSEGTAGPGRSWASCLRCGGR